MFALLVPFILFFSFFTNGPVYVPAQAIHDAKVASPTLWPVLISICVPESNCTPNAVGDGGCSIGYLQFDRCGGMGAYYARSTLFNGQTNMVLGARYIQGQLNRGYSLHHALQPWSTRSISEYVLYRIHRWGIIATG